jgi:hypothetical protein
MKTDGTNDHETRCNNSTIARGRTQNALLEISECGRQVALKRGVKKQYIVQAIMPHNWKFCLDHGFPDAAKSQSRGELGASSLCDSKSEKNSKFR